MILNLQSLNVTEATLTWTDPYLLLDGWNLIKTVIGVFAFVILFLGTYLIAAIIDYERFEMDPQKRGILNQVSRMTICTSINQRIQQFCS